MFNRTTFFLCLGGIFLGVILPSVSFADSSGEFFRVDGHIYDEWGVFRSRAHGTDGFLGVTSNGFDVVLAYESIGDNAEFAWNLGQEFKREYPNVHHRAEQIFYFVRDNVRYTSDLDQFGINEFAQNADELAMNISTNGLAYGDCEDSAFLLAVIYRAAGYRSALVLMPGHVAALVHLPQYRKATRKLQLAGENGWVWAEATGRTNPLGWVPESLMSGDMIGREVKLGAQEPKDKLVKRVTVADAVATRRSGRGPGSGIVAFLACLGILWIMGMRKQKSSKIRE